MNIQERLNQLEVAISTVRAIGDNMIEKLDHIRSTTDLKIITDLERASLLRIRKELDALVTRIVTDGISDRFTKLTSDL